MDLSGEIQMSDWKIQILFEKIMDKTSTRPIKNDGILIRPILF